MMRKDVKVGFAIGGVLIAVLIAYVLVSGGGQPNPIELVDGEPVQQVQPLGQETAVPADPQPPADAAAAQTPAKPTDPFAAGAAKSTEDVWAAALNQGKVLMSVTPSTSNTAAPVIETTTPETTVTEPVAATVEAPIAANLAADTGTTAPTTEPADIARQAQQNQTVRITETAPAPTGSRTHVIKSGETLTVIAIAVYGDQKYWTQIAAANPSINPNKLKVGTTITLPDLNAKPAALNEGAHPIDTANQYEVQPGDSLGRIASRLYGKEQMWKEIYELNKAAIGADPAKLKVGSILKLPPQPTAGR